LNVSLVVNPIAGNKAYKSISTLKNILGQKASLNTCVTQKKGDACLFSKGIRDADRIIVAGGDGTINEVINGICSSNNKGLIDVPVALVPLGTANVLAGELNIPEKIENAIDLALTGTAHKISLGRINGKYFSLMAGIGFDGETVLGVKNNIIKKISGVAAHAVSGLKVLAKYNPPPLEIKTDKGVFSGFTAIVCNARNYGGFFYIAPEASITEPVLDTCIFQGKKKKDFLRFIVSVLLKTHPKSPDVFLDKFSEIEIASSGTVHVQIDGEYAGTLPAKINVVQDAMSLIW
jgi:YegS/Rv2252/BmrU family lipid kinase